MSDHARPLRLHRPRRSEYGAGSGARIGDWAWGEGLARVLALTQPAMRRHLGLPGRVTVCDQVMPEPDTVNLALDAARGEQPDPVVGFGGGSVMDVAKLFSGLRAGQVLAEVVGSDTVAGRQNALALVPTTAGTGSEAGDRAWVIDAVTRNKMAVEARI